MPANSVDKRLQKVTMGEYITGNLGVGAFLVNERSHGQVGQHSASPYQDDDRRHDTRPLQISGELPKRLAKGAAKSRR